MDAITDNGAAVGMSQPTLFAIAKIIHRSYSEPHPVMSLAAYDRVNIDAECRATLAIIRHAGARGITADEIESIRGCGHQRIAELRRRGLIAPTGDRRRTRKGRMADVYAALQTTRNKYHAK